MFKTVEPMLGFGLHRNREAKKLELQMEQRKCLHLYHYLQHPVFGFMHVRVQTWFPFQVQIWLNGREWLARTLDSKGIAYQRRENCFSWIADVERAQRLMDEQLELCWPSALDLLRTKAPAHEQVFAACPLDYYWSVYQSEWATDIMFHDQRTLAELHQRLAHHGITRFGCRDVLRFLGKKLSADGNLRGNFAGEVTSDLKHRPEGIRLKHYVARNSVKIYDKQGTVLRTEAKLMTDAGMPRWR